MKMHGKKPKRSLSRDKGKRGMLYIITQPPEGKDPVSPRFEVRPGVWATKVFSTRKKAESYLAAIPKQAFPLSVTEVTLIRVLTHIQTLCSQEVLTSHADGTLSHGSGTHVDAIEVDGGALYPVLAASYDKVLEGITHPYSSYEQAVSGLMNHITSLAGGK